MRLLNDQRLSVAQTASVLDAVAARGGADELRMVFDYALADETADERRADLLSGLEEAARNRNVRPAGNLDGISSLLARENPELRAIAARCAGLWKVEALRDELDAVIRDGSSAAAVREAAIEGVAALGGDSSRKLLDELAGGDSPPELRRVAVIALVPVDPAAAAFRAATVLEGAVDRNACEGLFNAFLQRKDGPKVLATALAGRELHPDVAKVGLRLLESSGRTEPELWAALTASANVATGPKVLSAEEMQSLIADVNEHGDAARGENVFRRADLLCFRCHSIGGAGGLVGPDLISLGGSSQLDYIIDSLLQPNKAVKENYHTVIVSTLEGRVYTGVKVRQTSDELILRDAEDREVAVPLDSIDQQAPGASVMPTGLIDKLTHDELVDLVRFLSMLGKPGPFSIGPERLVRRWQVLADTPEAHHRLQRTSYDAAAQDDAAFSWLPAYSTVSGELPLGVLPEFRVRFRAGEGDRGAAFARCELDVSHPGACKLRLNSAGGLSCWLDGEPIEVFPETVLELTQGRHRLTLAVDLNRRTAPLRLKLDEIEEGATVQAVGGK